MSQDTLITVLVFLGVISTLIVGIHLLWGKLKKEGQPGDSSTLLPNEEIMRKLKAAILEYLKKNGVIVSFIPQDNPCDLKTESFEIYKESYTVIARVSGEDYWVHAVQGYPQPHSTYGMRMETNLEVRLENELKEAVQSAIRGS